MGVEARTGAGGGADIKEIRTVLIISNISVLSSLSLASCSFCSTSLASDFALSSSSFRTFSSSRNFYSMIFVAACAFSSSSRLFRSISFSVASVFVFGLLVYLVVSCWLYVLFDRL